MAVELNVKLVKLLDEWETASPKPVGEELVSLLTKIAEIFETATELYLKKDPDPFDGRHPSRAHPNSALGHLLKKVFKNQNFINAVLHEYLSYTTDQDTQMVACRILLDLLPGIDPQVFRENGQMITNLILWTERASNPLQSYALGVLAVAMDDEDIAVAYKEQNACLVPIMLERLEDLSKQYFEILFIPTRRNNTVERPFAHLNKESKNAVEAGCSNDYTPVLVESQSENNSSHLEHPDECSRTHMLPSNECSCNSWSEMEPLMIGPYQVYPLTLANEQRYILQYLTSVGVFPELQTSVLEDPTKILNLIMRYIDLKEHSNVRVAFDALRYLGILLCHKRCAIDFIYKMGVHHLLCVHRPPLATTGVSFVLYYLGNNQDAMLKVCALPRAVIMDIISYVIWLLEYSSHGSGRAHATMFLEYAFQFESIRTIFDEQEGLRKLLNTVSTLDIVLRSVARNMHGILNQDHVISSRHVCKHAILALKKYFEWHTDAKAAALRRSHTSSTSRPAAYKKTLEENVETLVSLMTPPISWEPIDKFLKLDGIHFLLKLIYMLNEWSYSGKMETVRNALDILFVCTVSDTAKLQLCDTVHYVTLTQETAKSNGMTMVLQFCMGEILPDAEIRRAALNVMVNCVCGQVIRESQLMDIIHPSIEMKLSRGNEEIMHKVWNCVRSNNGIMILRMLLTTKAPVMGADAIRALACQALCGLARSERVMQILSKIQLLTSGQLQVLMREPILRDKRQEHAKFVKYCTKLIEMVSGKSVHSQLANTSKAEIVAQTVITYEQRQLLQLIAEHLYDKGLQLSAATLVEEAKLDPIAIWKCNNKNSMMVDPLPESNPKTSHSSSEGALMSTAASNVLDTENTNHSPLFSDNSISESSMPKDEFTSFAKRYSASRQFLFSENICSSLAGKRTQATITPVDKAHDVPPAVKRVIIECQDSMCSALPSRCSSANVIKVDDKPTIAYKAPVHSSVFGSHSLLTATPERRILTPKSKKSGDLQNPAAQESLSSSAPYSTYTRSRFMKKETILQEPVPVVSNSVNLDSIVSEYLRSQHAVCKTPYVTCPPFDLLTHHHCPEPRYKNAAPCNITLGFMQKQFTPSHWNYRGSSMTRKFMSSRFRDLNSFLDPQGSTMTQCAFAHLEDKVYVGTFNGEIKVYGTLTGSEIHGFNCHETEVTNIQSLKHSHLFLTSAQWRRPVTALWDASHSYQLVHRFHDECYAEFSKLTLDRIIATKYERAQIYDLYTGKLVTTLNESDLGNSYRLNRATFNHTDHLVLSDGVIWDVKSQKPIHKLDKFNPRINGVFHPNGLEILSNSEVWDMRTYRLLRTVPELEQSKLIFDHTGDVIYGAILAPEIDHDNSCFKRYGLSFRAFDGFDYSCIATRDVQRGINDIDISPDDKYFCVIQSSLSEPLFGGYENRCHVYEIGRGYEDDDLDGVTEDEETKCLMSDDDLDDSAMDEQNGFSDAQSSDDTNSVSDEELYFYFRA